MKTIQIKDFGNKHNTMIFRKEDMKPIGIIHCFAATEWEAINADGHHIDWFTSKAAALAALIA